MKKALLAAAVAATLAACGTKTDDKAAATGASASAPAAAAAGTTADLSATKSKLPLTVAAPEGYTVNDSTAGEGAVEINSEAANFKVSSLGEMKPAEALASAKKEVETNGSIGQLKSYVVDTPEGFIANVGTSYIPYRQVKAGSATYELTVIPLFALPSEEEAKKVYDMMGTLKAK